MEEEIRENAMFILTTNQNQKMGSRSRIYKGTKQSNIIRVNANSDEVEEGIKKENKTGVHVENWELFGGDIWWTTYDFVSRLGNASLSYMDWYI